MTSANERYDSGHAKRFYSVVETLKRKAEGELLKVAREAQFNRLLDIGCGDGHFLLNFPNKEVFGLDLSKAMVSQADPSIKDRIFLEDICNPSKRFMDKNTGRFDLVTSNYLLTELTEDQLKSAFGNVYALLGQNASLHFTITDPRTRAIQFPGSRNIFSEPYKYEKRDLAFKVLLANQAGQFVDVGIVDYHRPLEDYIDLMKDIGFRDVSHGDIKTKAVRGKSLKSYALLMSGRKKDE